MPIARSKQICVTSTPYYHCISRCVRRAYLCGKDAITGQSYEHRKTWVEQRMLRLSRYFAIDICAYAVMSNHTHLVLKVDIEKASSWTREEICSRWFALFRQTTLSSTFMDEKKRQGMSAAELIQVDKMTEIYRSRLSDISWFMRTLNEYIARKANAEDACTGRFWEGRFKSQALLDDASVIACMAYVDLNPIRAGIAENIEQAEYTSIKRRLEASATGRRASELVAINELPSSAHVSCLSDYIAILNSLYRPKACHNRHPKKKYSSNTQLVFAWLNQQSKNFQQLAGSIETDFSHAMGNYDAMKKYQQRVGQKHLRGINRAKYHFRIVH